MKKDQGGFILIIVGIVAMIGITVGLFFYINAQSKIKQDKLRADFAKAGIILDTETNKLDELKQSFLSSHPENIILNNEYLKAKRSIENNVNVLFDEARINAERAKIALMLELWKKNLGSLYGEISAENILAMINQAQAIQAIINNLQNILNDLTPTNSGLTQAQINEYLAGLQQAGQEIQNIINNIENTQTPPITSTPPGSTTPPVTPEEIAAQEAVVAQAQEQVDNIASELGDTSTETPPPLQTPPPSPPPPPPPAGGPPNGNPPGSGDNTPGDDIIIQPGIPQLIEGANQN